MPEWSVAPAPRPQSAESAERVAPSPRTPRRGLLSLSVPDGDDCLRELAADGATFHVIPPKPGMRTPVSIVGSLGGVKYHSDGVGSLVCDCRLAVVLGRLGPELSRLGVTEVRHMGAYAYRTTRTGRASLHAYGLAIDIGGVDVGGERLSVVDDYRRGDLRCEPRAPALNHVACAMRQTGFFEEVLTPDDDRDHRDHLHLAILPL